MSKKRIQLQTWERQPNESVQAYEALTAYLKMGSKRSINKVAQELHKSHALIGRWSRVWKWQDRSRDYDADLRRMEVEEAKQAMKKMQQRQIQTAMLMQKKAVEALNNLPADALTAKDIKEFIKIATDLERINRSFEDENRSEVTGATLADAVITAYKKRRGDDDA